MLKRLCERKGATSRPHEVRDWCSAFSPSFLHAHIKYLVVVYGKVTKLERDLIYFIQLKEADKSKERSL